MEQPAPHSRSQRDAGPVPLKLRVKGSLPFEGEEQMDRSDAASSPQSNEWSEMKCRTPRARPHLSKSNASKIAALLASCFMSSVALAQATAPLTSGIDRTTADPAVRMQDDAFRAVNGKWLATTVIPADRNGTGNFVKLYDLSQSRSRGLIEGLAKSDSTSKTDADAKKIGDLYASFMDEAHADQLGIAPMHDDLAKIDAIATRADVAAEIGELDRIGANVPLNMYVHQDAKDSTRYVVDLFQGGIGLPNRDYFLAKTDQRFAAIRVKYRVYLEKLLTMSGDRDAAAHAQAVVGLEAMIAKAHWTAVENRDAVKTYNPTAIKDLPGLAPHIEWSAYLKAATIAGRTDSIIISEPSYVRGLDKLVASVPLSTWKAYFKTRLLTAYAPYLDRAAVDTAFAFNSTVLRGTPENEPRWKRGVNLVEQSIGEGVGRLYVAQYFPEQNKARVDAMVRNLLAAYKVSIDGLDWMGPETKKEAQIKLATFVPKIGYPAKWRDYSALVMERNDLVGNVERATRFESDRNLAKLGQPIDRGEWGMTPQTINAYYNPEQNEIVFPAGILQPPFFDVTADDAANYGAVGAVIGHEISHGFDDQGSRYDEKGNLRDWWTKDDHRRFDAKSKALIAQYNAYSPVAGYHVNGALTLGENIADNSGLAIAYKAYHLSLKGQPAPVIDGQSGDQRFYLGFAQVWQSKIRDESLIAQVKSNEHSPPEFRVNGTLVNQPGFYEAFSVKKGDKLFKTPEKRVLMW
jgi:putative endopeptidase